MAEAQELMRHANISVTLNIYAQAITQSKRHAQSRVVSLLLDKNAAKPSTEAYRTYKNLEGICNWLRRLASPTGFEPVLPP